jgi:hypothetical protein
MLTILDLKSNSDRSSVYSLIESRRQGVFYAFTPLAAWILESKGIRYRTLQEIMDESKYHRECMNNLERVRELLKTIQPEDTEPFLGLYYWIKLFADYLFQENAKFEFLKDKEVLVITDVLAGDGTFGDHVLNRRSLYVECLQKSDSVRIKRIKRKLKPSRAIKGFLKALGFKKVQAFLGSRGKKRLDGRHGTVIAAFHYDWEIYKTELLTRYSSLTPVELVDWMKKEGAGAQPVASIESFLSQFNKKFGSLSKEILVGAASVLKKEVSRYFDLQALIKANIGKAILHSQIKGALGTYTSSFEEFLTAYYLKQANIPTLFYQHGAYFPMEMNLSLEYSEVLPATVNLVIGKGDADLFEKSSALTRCEVVGSAALERLPQSTPPENGKFLYVLDVSGGNAAATNSDLYWPTLDGLSILNRHRAVIDLFAQFPEHELLLKPHSGYLDWCLYTPLKEYIRSRKIRNVRMMGSNLRTTDLLSKFQYVILDYACTTLLQALALGHKGVVCHIGKTVLLPAAVEQNLVRAYPCTKNDDELIALLRSVLKKNKIISTNEAGFRHFNELYGCGSDSYSRVSEFLKVALERKDRSLHATT